MSAEACVHTLAGSVRLCLILQLVFVWSLGLVRGERLTASHVFTVPAHSPIHVQPSRYPGIGPSFSKTPVNIFSPQFFHRGFYQLVHPQLIMLLQATMVLNLCL